MANNTTNNIGNYEKNFATTLAKVPYGSYVAVGIEGGSGRKVVIKQTPEVKRPEHALATALSFNRSFEQKIFYKPQIKPNLRRYYKHSEWLCENLV